MQTLRGMKDHLPKEQALYRWMLHTSLKIAHRFQYQEISTPLLEHSEVFTKTLGDESDIIGKEIYEFKDKGEQPITLRPEGTAGTARLFINEKLHQQLPLRVSYCGPMFRYERPQKGRLRQFHQFGVELFGKSDVSAEIELITMAEMILKELKIKSKVILQVNTLGDISSRKQYTKKLVEYLTPYQKELSSDSQLRLSKNPLRILDSKDTKDKKILANAPLPKTCLNQSSLSFYEKFLSGLSQQGISFNEQPFLVRGLDYYTHIVFEYTSDQLGSQNTLLAGGRYDLLVSQMGGTNTCATGWAFGIERAMLLSDDQPSIQPMVGVVSAQESMHSHILPIANQLRSMISVYTPEISSLSKQMKKAHSKGCSYLVILGSNEWNKKQVLVKDMKNGTQKNVPLDSLVSYFTNQSSV